MRSHSIGEPTQIDMPKDAFFGRGGISELGKEGDAQDYVTLATKGVIPRATKVSAVLSTSYSDADFRATVGLIDDRGIKNDGRTRRRLRLELQKEVIGRNGQVLDDFSSVSEVSPLLRCLNPSIANHSSNSNASNQHLISLITATAR